MGGQRLPFGVLWQHRTTPPIYSQYQSRPVEIAEHDGDAPVYRKMRLRFIARPAQIEISHPVRRQHTKRVIAFGRKIDPAIGSSSRSKENRLLADHFNMLFVQGFGEVSHICSPALAFRHGVQFLGQRLPAQHLVAVRKAAEALDDIAVHDRKLQRLCFTERVEQLD